jgi:hypothetical protein
MAKNVSTSYAQEGTPWLAVGLLIGWTIIEAILFTFVITETAINILSNFAQEELDLFSVRPILFMMMVVFILGSYAVVTSLGEAIKKKDWNMILFISAFEICVAGFEVLFLYREFVDALVPWFKQYSPDFNIGAVGVIAIATFVWFGIRGMTWFLFAQAGAPTIMAIIQRTGLQVTHTITRSKDEAPLSAKDIFQYVNAALDRIKSELDWLHQKGEEMISAFVLPGLQLVAACVNFCTVLISSSHLFDLPFKSFKDVLDTRELILKAKEDTKEQ